MSAAPTVGIPRQPWSTTRLVIVVALALAVIAVVLGVYSLGRTDRAAPQTSDVPAVVEADPRTSDAPAVVEADGRAGGDGNCAERFAMTGGHLEDVRPPDRCPPAGGTPITGGRLP